MTASSSVVISNLAYLVGAVVLAIIGGIVVWLRHRKPKSVAANVESFHRGLRALAPDSAPPRGGGAGDPDPGRVTALPGIRLTPARPEPPGTTAPVIDAGPAADPGAAEVPSPAQLSDQIQPAERREIDLTEAGSGSHYDNGAEAGEAAADRAGAETG